MQVYVEQREDGERFLDVVLRLGLEPFKERVYARRGKGRGNGAGGGGVTMRRIIKNRQIVEDHWRQVADDERYRRKER